ncbi:hypothetical protein [Allosphingosinicella deserti]|uniref:Uncharacterized protein n=1 Tax=Allosphingosinicella deserti TaxID=2116704 RepID=A0A2P7QLF8_9SPHN|nr:hypothetical protein [Sphingomonas deserti]PSJ38796.1 hypothetical protein C7I55_15820 [Sphingomonas deserti]
MGILSLFGTGMALQFEKQGETYVYRANGRGPARPVTKAEHDRFVRRGGIDFLLHCAAFGLCVIAAAMITAHWFPDGGEPGGFVLMGILLVAIVYALYRSLHWWMLAPERTLADRTPVAPARPGARPKPRRRFTPPSSAYADQPRQGGCLLLLGFALAELVGGLAAGFGAYTALDALVRLVLPGGGAPAVAPIGAFLAGLVTVFLIDRWCKRRTGTSILDEIPYIP